MPLKPPLSWLYELSGFILHCSSCIMGHSYHHLLVVSTKLSVFLVLLMIFLNSLPPFFTWLTLTHPIVPGQAPSPCQASPVPILGSAPTMLSEPPVHFSHPPLKSHQTILEVSTDKSVFERCSPHEGGGWVSLSRCSTTVHAHNRYSQYVS